VLYTTRKDLSYKVNYYEKRNKCSITWTFTSN
jgi:hypothetical protein